MSSVTRRRWRRGTCAVVADIGNAQLREIEVGCCRDDPVLANNSRLAELRVDDLLVLPGYYLDNELTGRD